MAHSLSNLAPSSTSPVRLLYVEHESDDVELSLRELKNSGLDFTADTASTRDEFNRKLRAHPFDVVLADYRLPGWTGMDALTEIQKLGLDIPLILVTGTLGDGLAVECIKRGVTDYVLKEQLARLPMALVRAQEEKILREAERHAVVALRASEARYRSLVDNATYGIYRVTADGELLHVNPALVQILGYDSAEDLLAVKNTSSLYCNSSLRPILQETFRRRGRVDSQVEWNRKDGKTVTVRLSGRRVTDLDQKSDCAEVIVEDVTERLVLEKQLLQAQKFEGIGQLAGGIAHDFNNMIGAILGWADLGIEETEPASRLHRHFEKIRHQADRAAALTRQLLAFARRQILEPRNIDLNRTITETLNLLEKVIGGNIEIKKQFASDLAVVRADPTQVEQVLMNLCINARDAMPEGGSLSIETRNVCFDEEYCLHHPFARTGRYAMIAVSDTGTGMDAATLDRIFEPFFTTKGQGKGTGLATVYGIVRQSCGFINVYSELAMGTTFRVYLPTSAEVEKTPDTTEDLRPVRGGTETILVAEDHEGLREIARETLATLGYKVLLVTDGEQALHELQTRAAQIDLALLDVVLPKLSGPEVYARICAENHEFPVIFATGYSSEMSQLDDVQRQGLPILQKPYAPRDLARKVREALDQRRLVSHD
jgi:two-component system, cell cycle sensor histidine kinase and response regulator CckA